LSRELIYLAPEIIVVVMAMAILGLDLLLNNKNKALWLTGVSVAGFALAALSAAPLFGERVVLMSGMFIVDTFGLIMKIIILLGALLSVLLAAGLIRRPQAKPGEYIFLLSAATVGMMLMTGAANLLTVFLSVQLASIPLYVMTGFLPGDKRSVEAALKYLLLGVMAAAVTLFGMSFVYGITGNLGLAAIAESMAAAKNIDTMLILGLVFVVAGISFKIAAVPFHFWAPDVYEGAPTAVSAFIAAVPKVAGFAVLTRLVLTAFPSAAAQWTALFALLSILSMILGNIMAIPQKNIKRLLAFAGITHVGYMLIALAAPGQRSVTALIFYLLVYMIMTVGMFAMTIAVCGESNENDTISAFTGLGRRAPLAAAGTTVLLLSMFGFPLTGGFIAKLLLFGAAVDKGMTWLAIIGVVNGVISFYYYFGIIREMYLREPGKKRAPVFTYLNAIVIIAAVILTILLGIFPEPVLRLVQGASLVFTNL
jgi:NADH-quinone oxidoreductase subunit N